MDLRLEQCMIRDWRVEDAASLAREANNRNVSMHLRDQFPFPYTIADAEKYLRRVSGEEPCTTFCIDIGGAVAGGIGLELGSDVHRHTAAIGYWLGQEFWGRGIMTDVVRAVTDWAFESFSLHRVAAEVFANNPGSARVLEKAGYHFEGRLRNNVIKNGVVLDSLLYAKTRDRIINSPSDDHCV